MKKNGRPEAIAKLVREAVYAAGHAGAMYADIRAAHPALRMKHIRHCTGNNVVAGLLVRHGPFRHPRFFAPDVPQAAIQAAIAADDAKRKAIRIALDKAQSQRLSELRKKERAAKSNGTKATQVDAKLPDWWGDLVAFVEANPGQTMAILRERFGRSRYATANAVDRLHALGRLVARMDKNRALVFPVGMPEAEIAAFLPVAEEKSEKRRYTKKLVKATQAINALADKFRGTAAPKERVAVVVTGMDTAPRIVAPARPGRYEADPASLSGLSRLPIGVYAEPASRWASVATDRRAA